MIAPVALKVKSSEGEMVVLAEGIVTALLMLISPPLPDWNNKSPVEP